ncbi:MAG: DEAD/DEAH box helicase family protein [Deltaproteobacteria bacterium]|nr:DEAD/DEAH box helicase family protein [Deltaproteobacteria bacterium]
MNSLKKEISDLKQILRVKEEKLDILLQNISITPPASFKSINSKSDPREKIKLFRKLFRGREGIYALRFESTKSGKSGYQPVCINEWIQGICNKPHIKCQKCNHRLYQKVIDETIENHLKGEIPPKYSGGVFKPFVIGIYPLMTDETCWFLAVDFDKKNWIQDAGAYLDTCREENIPAYLERSRSGNGGHVWIFFNEPVEAKVARNMGSLLMTMTLDKRPDVGLDSFDRFFPNQDTLPVGGLGNLIALPLQKRARERNHSVFLNEDFIPYDDQWLFLADIERMDRNRVESYVENAKKYKEILPISHNFSELQSDDITPWIKHKKLTFPKIDTPLPKKIDIIISNQIFISSTGLPPIFMNRILRLASFSNPEFYKAQRMRLSTWNKPRIIYCFEQFPQHIALPIGCFDELKGILVNYNINPEIVDKRNKGISLDVKFHGTLQPEQFLAAEALEKYETGVLSATTAFGKTVIALWLIAQRRVNTLILVHRKQLMEQWMERIIQFLGILKKDIGCFGGGRKKRNGLIDVAVIQSVSKKGDVEGWISEYGQVIVDECHHVSPFSFGQAIRQSDGYYKLGLSATLTRKDGRHPIIFMNLGQIRYKVSARKEAKKRSFDHIVITKNTSFLITNPEDASKNIQELFRELYLDTQRNLSIASDIEKASSENRQMIVLSERTEHLSILKDLLEKKVKNLFVLKGGMGKKQLRKIMEDIESVPDGHSRVLLATGKYLGEGFDLPALDTLFLTFPVSWKGTLTQYAGRLHRDYYATTEVIIYDYLDKNIPVLQRMYNKRLKGYTSLGYRVD